MDKHPIENLMQTTLENMKDMVDVNTVVGDPIQAVSGDTVIPISKVSFGFVSGGGEYDTKNAIQEATLACAPFAGGSGAGVSVQPVGFLVVGENGVYMLPAQNVTLAERAMNCVPKLLEDVKALFPSDKEKNKPGCEKKDGSQA